MNDPPYVVTFYSYKGGVGRSMALLNTAYTLSGWGRNVLVLDLDLEAPGISGFLHRKDELDGRSPMDVVDLLQAVVELAQDGPAEAPAAELVDQLPARHGFVAAVKPEKLKKLASRGTDLGRIDVIAAHCDDNEDRYAQRLDGLALGNWPSDKIVRVSQLLGAYVRAQRLPIEVPDYWGDDAPRDAPYDYVLVDSRTGLTDVGGLCIGPLADALVVLAGLNDQNIEGTRYFLDLVGLRASGRRKRAKPTLLVASPVPDGDMELRGRRLIEFERKVGKLAATLSYNPRLALFETAFVRDFPDEHLSSDYRRLATSLLDAGDDGMPRGAGGRYSAARRAGTELAAQIMHLVRAAPVAAEAAATSLSSVLRWSRPNTEDEFRAADLAFRYINARSGRKSGVLLSDWAWCLMGWAEGTEDHNTRDLRLKAAEALLTTCIDGRLGSPGNRLNASRSRGIARERRGDLRGAITDFDAVIAVADAPFGMQAMARYNRGVLRGRLEDPFGAIADFTAVIEMPEAPAEQRASALVNRGHVHGRQGNGVAALADYDAVIAMPDAPAEQRAMALTNRGWHWFERAEYQRSAEDSRAALALDATMTAARANLGVALLQLGESAEAAEQYRHTLATQAMGSQVEKEVLTDLRAALAEAPDLPGAAEILALAEARKAELEAAGKA